MSNSSRGENLDPFDLFTVHLTAQSNLAPFRITLWLPIILLNNYHVLQELFEKHGGKGEENSVWLCSGKKVPPFFPMHEEELLLAPEKYPALDHHHRTYLMSPLCLLVRKLVGEPGALRLNNGAFRRDGYFKRGRLRVSPRSTELVKY